MDFGMEKNLSVAVVKSLIQPHGLPKITRLLQLMGSFGLSAVILKILAQLYAAKIRVNVGVK